MTDIEMQFAGMIVIVAMIGWALLQDINKVQNNKGDHDE